MSKPQVAPCWETPKAHRFRHPVPPPAKTQPGACGRSHPTPAVEDAAYCGSVGAAGGGQLGAAAAAKQVAAAGQYGVRALNALHPACRQDQAGESFTAGHQTTRS